MRASVDFPTRSGPSITMNFGACGPRCVFRARLAEDDSCAVIVWCRRAFAPAIAVKSIAGNLLSREHQQRERVRLHLAATLAGSRRIEIRRREKDMVRFGVQRHSPRAP